MTHIDSKKKERLRQLEVADAVLRMRNWYSCELEFRVYTEQVRNWIEPSEAGLRSGMRVRGIWVECNLARLIESVVVAPKTPSYMESAIREVLQRFDFDPELVRPCEMNQAIQQPDPTR